LIVKVILAIFMGASAQQAPFSSPASSTSKTQQAPTSTSSWQQPGFHCLLPDMARFSSFENLLRQVDF
jgi:hypothetical protein